MVDDRRDDSVPVPLDPPAPVGALEDGAVEVDGASVDVVGRLQVDGGLTGQGVEVPHPVADHVGESQTALPREPAGALEPGAAGEEALEPPAGRKQGVDASHI